MSAFVIQTGKYRGKRLRLSEPELVVGRDESCRVRLSSEEVSRFHCQIRRTDDGWTVRDLGSSNGTYVNSVAIDGERVLKSGDLLSVGPMILEFSDEAKSAAQNRAAKQPSMSDEDIATWLSDEAIPASTGDTTIISAAQLRAPAETPPPRVESPARESSATNIVAPPERQFDSVAEEAADIIRRHWESQEAEADDGAA